MIKKISWIKLIVVVLTTELVGVLGGLSSGNTGNTYTEFNKPPFSPPGWLFGVVWPILYLLMSIAAYLIYKTPRTEEREKATNLYWIQLFVNFVWPIVFFRFEMYWVSVAVIILLDILVLLTMIRFYRINKVAGYLLIPYMVWIIFATYLNIAIAILN